MKKFMLFLGVLLFGVTSVNTAQVGQIWEPPIVPSIYKEKQNIPTPEQIKTAEQWCLKYNLPLNKKCIYL